MPEAAKAHTAAGAEAFVKFYWEMVNYAQFTGDLDALEQLGEDGCAACNGGVKFLRNVYAKGGTVKGGRSTVSELHATRLSVGNHDAYEVTFKLANTLQVIDYEGDKDDQRYPAAIVSGQFVVDPATPGWSVGFWTTQS
ncbi:DUF6318 family protein [Nocardioides sp. LS1]|uniref:DUF6318 family protein n=1 Tax=Nocardioides sp. LS1 TaxID=1027620 RepID=UPI000FF99809|nr:DUF6318 family protein [Nocardioides sp. LS1]GCD91451.1 hypothetical protein NLS1_34570 [Nocardioides sp. LS1]